MEAGHSVRERDRQPSSAAKTVRAAQDSLLLSNLGTVTVEAIRSGIDLSHVDSDARPQDDLFGHVNGRWLADYEIPADRATDGAFRSLFDRAEEQVRDLITEAAAESGADTGTDEQRIGDLYASFMDEAAVATDRRGSRCSTSWPPSTPPSSPDALAAVLGGLQRTRRGRRHRSLRRHRFQGLHPLPGAPQPVRAGAARRVLLPRRAARRDPRRLPAAHRRDVRARRTAAAPTTTPKPRRASSHWKPSWPPRTGTWSSAVTPTSPTTCAHSPTCPPRRRASTGRAGSPRWAGRRRRPPRWWCASPTT